MSFHLIRHIRLVNLFAILASAATFPYIFIFHAQGIPLSGWALIFFLVFAGTLFWNLTGRYTVAKFWLYLAAHIYLFITASTFGREAGEHMILIPVLFGAVLVFEFREKVSLIFAFLFTCLTMVLLILTDWSLMAIPVTVQQINELYYGNLFITLFCCVTIATFYFVIYGRQFEENQAMIETGKEIERTIHYFSTSLYGKNSVNEILWDVAKNCIGRLGFVDCVIYLLDEERQVLVQKAAYGRKNPSAFDIHNPLEIPAGQGIVGYVCQNGQPLIVPDTTRDPRYIQDEVKMLSEITAPLIYNGKVIGVIDSEHPEKNYFTDRHLNVLSTICSLCANKVARTLADIDREKALTISLEAEKIRAIEEIKTRLFATVSHELRTPLTMIMGTVDRQLKTAYDPDWQAVRDQTDELLVMINQLVDLTRLESGHFELNERKAEMIGFFRDMAQTVQQQGMHLDVRLPGKPVWLLFDHDALEKIFTNILTEVRKYTDKESTVMLKAEYERKLVVTISGYGKGVPFSEEEKIFHRYLQTDQTDQTHPGIGLALSRELVRWYRGNISVFTEDGHGSQIIVVLPLMETTAKPSPATVRAVTAKVNETRPHGKRTILLIEDNDALSDFICHELADEYRFIQAFDSRQALEATDDEIPDLILSDIMLPGMNGIQLCREFRQDDRTRTVPLILISARTDSETKNLGMAAGADAFIPKPFHTDELKEKLREVLSREEIIGDIHFWKQGKL